MKQTASAEEDERSKTPHRQASWSALYLSFYHQHRLSRGHVGGEQVEQPEDAALRTTAIISCALELALLIEALSSSTRQTILMIFIR